MRTTSSYLTLFLLTIMTWSTAVAQELNWIVTDEVSENNQIYCYLGSGPAGHGFVYTFPQYKVISFSDLKYGIAIRHYDADMKEYNQRAIPENTPPYLTLRPFNQYIVIQGTGEDKESQKGDAVVIFLDQDGNELTRKAWSLSGKRHIWTTKSCFQTADSAYLFVQFTEQCIPDMPSPKKDPENHFVAVFDRDLKVVWEGNIDLDAVFPEAADAYCWETLFTPDHRILLVGREKREKLMYAAVYEVRDDKSEPKRIFDIPMAAKPYGPMQSYRSSVLLAADGRLFISCLTKSNDKPYDLALACKNIVSGEELYVKYLLLDKSFDEKYPEFGKGHNNFPGGFQAVELEDGILLCGELSQSAPSYALKNISFIKIDSKGEIAWTRILERNLGVTADYLYSLRVFKWEDRYVFFYMDHPDKVTGGTVEPAPPGTAAPTCIVRAFIDADGTISEKKIVHNNRASKIVINTGHILHADEYTYLLMGQSGGKNAWAVYTLE